jgi:hypothetical protein
MRALRLAGHYGKTVEIDLCEPCHLVWFDSVESANLAGPGLFDLIERMAAAQSQAHQALRPQFACPRCRLPLKPVHNQTRWGKSLQVECPSRHGSAQTFAQFLGEKGLVRPLGSADRHRLMSAGAVHCLNCGAPLAADDTACSWCQSVPSLIDVARLAHALDPEGATEAHAVHRRPAAVAVLSCLACGTALPPSPLLSCPQCAATLATPRLAEAVAQAKELGPALRAHAERPAPHVVAKRLASQAADMERRRDWAADMQAEADARAGRTDGVEPMRWPMRWGTPERGKLPTAVALVLLLLLLWWMGG